MPAPADLRTIRALSQYRPFEGRGQGTRDAQEDIVLAALAEAGGAARSISECTQHINTLFGLHLEEVSVAGALGRLLKDGSIEKNTAGEFSLSATESQRLQEVAAKSQATASAALDDWYKSLTERWPLTTQDLDALEQSLRVYLTTVLRRHGVEASLLLYPDSEDANRLYDELETLGFDFLPEIDEGLREVRDFALSLFVRRPSDNQRDYLAANLNTSYFLTALSIDSEGARLVAEVVRGQRVYVDTNFVYRLLGVQGPRYVKPAEAILRATTEAGYSSCVTPWTITEFRESLRRSREFLEKYPIPPSEYAAIAAEATSDENFVTAYWRRVRNGPLKVADFVEKYEEVETLLSDRDILIQSEGCTAVDQMKDATNDEISILERALHGRDRHPALLEHDVKHRLLIRRLRSGGARNFSNAGYWFLTHDTVLPRYDHIASAGSGDLAFCVSAGSWFQIVDAFRPKTDDPEQSLADMLASPYVRYRRTLSQEAALSIVARVHEYSDGTPELAARVMMNSAAVHENDSAPSDTERTTRIDSAIVAAAKAVQEDARKDKEIAQTERERAELIERQADDLLREAQREARRRLKVFGKGGTIIDVPIPTEDLRLEIESLILERNPKPTEYLLFPVRRGKKMQVGQRRITADAPIEVLWEDRLKPLDANGMQRWWKRCIEAAGIPYLNMHAARHTAITDFLRFSGNLKLTQQLARHKDISTTANIYAHLDDMDLEQALRRLHAED